MKIRTPRIIPLSHKWRKLVVKNSGVTESKEVNQIILKLWLLGYSHKDAATKIQGDLL